MNHDLLFTFVIVFIIYDDGITPGRETRNWNNKCRCVKVKSKILAEKTPNRSSFWAILPKKNQTPKDRSYTQFHPPAELIRSICSSKVWIPTATEYW